MFSADLIVIKKKDSTFASLNTIILNQFNCVQNCRLYFLEAVIWERTQATFSF